MKPIGMPASVRIAVSLLVLTAVSPAAGAERQVWQAWNVAWENDSFNPWSKRATDQLYTNGLRIVIARARKHNFGWARLIQGWFPGAGAADQDTISALVFGQHIFTPTVITNFDVDPADRPYAGYLYAGGLTALTQASTASDSGWGTSHRQTLEWHVGVMGPAALAGQTQKAVHAIRGNRIPKGWGHQLGNEFAVNTLYQFELRAGSPCLDVIPRAGLAVGTIQTYATLGVTVRIGHNMRGFPTTPNMLTKHPPAKRPTWELAVFAGADGRALLRNAYLDGNLFGGSPRVEKKPRVGDSRAGVTYRHQSWRVTAQLVWRGPAFEGAFGGRSHTFGSVSLGREFEPR